MKISYEPWKPNRESAALVQTVERIASDYQRQGYDLTVRQLYYQLVARAIVPNNERSYQRVIGVVNKARLAGMLDWQQITDRTRTHRSNSHWETPGDVIDSAAEGYGNDLWVDQPERVEVWVEKEALAGVVSQAASRWDCSWFSCRGYVSQSAMWRAAQRINRYLAAGQRVTILHLGDHDPSGIDMTRDIRDRLQGFIVTDWLRGPGRGGIPLDVNGAASYGAIRQHMSATLGGEPLTVDRIALNMDQIEQYNPPPNPAKMSDSRAADYVEQYGDESWELDALDPSTLDVLIGDSIGEHIDLSLYMAAETRQEHDRELLRRVAREWDLASEPFRDDE